MPRIEDMEEFAPWDGLIWNPPRWHAAALHDSQILQELKISFPQLPLYPHPNPEAFRLIGTAIVRIREFDAKRLVRHIKYRQAGSASDKDVPEIGQTGGGTSASAPVNVRTRWDMSLHEKFHEHGGMQRIEIRFILEDNLIGFIWDGHFPVTAKDVESQRMLVNPAYHKQSGRGVSVDLLFEPGNPVLTGIASYNIAVMVTDREDGRFKLPILIDPRVRNMG